MKNKILTPVGLKRKRRSLVAKRENLLRQIEQLDREISSLRTRCLHENAESYVNYEDSGWSCPDCGEDFPGRTHPSKRRFTTT
jgi:hypothetical protein